MIPVGPLSVKNQITPSNTHKKATVTPAKRAHARTNNILTHIQGGSTYLRGSKSFNKFVYNLSLHTQTGAHKHI